MRLGRRRSSSSGWASRQSSSSYPRQTWGRSSSSYPRQTVGGTRGLGGGGFVAPKPISRGTYSAPGGKTFGSATPGHGTSWGTSFPSGVGRYQSKGVSKKALGLGIGAGSTS